MVRSLLDSEVTYREDRSLFEADMNYNTFLYEAMLYNMKILIALGQAKHEYNANDIVYYPIYLVTPDSKKIRSKIGVYEVSVSDAAINVDENGEPDISLFDEPLIFSFVTKAFIEKSVPKTVVSEVEAEEKAEDKPPSVSESKEMTEDEVAQHVQKVVSIFGDDILEISMKDFKNKLYSVSGKTKSDFKKWKEYIKDIVTTVVNEKIEEMKQSEKSPVTPSPVIPVSSRKYIREQVPGDGWCSMHAVDQFLKHVGVFDEIPGNNQVPITLQELEISGNTFVTPAVQSWMARFAQDQTLWNADFGSGNHSTPDAACEYIKMKTRENYECLRNVFTMGKDTLPKELRNNTEFTNEEIKNIINTNSQIILIRENPNATTAGETDQYADDQEIVIFINTGNHWEIIYSPNIPKVFIETPIPTSLPSPTKSPSLPVVKIGSKVRWTKNGKVFEGEIVKITPKTYKICCKPNKKKEDANSLYMVPKETVSLKE